jgi:hypothetical protein
VINGYTDTGSFSSIPRREPEITVVELGLVFPLYGKRQEAGDSKSGCFSRLPYPYAGGWQYTSSAWEARLL